MMVSHFRTVTTRPNLALRRLAARMLDFLLVLAAVQALHRLGGQGLDPLSGLILYQLVIALCKGQSLGKALLGLQFVGVGPVTRWRLVLRELLLWLLLPVVLVSFVSVKPLHDRWANIEVVLHG